MENLKELILRHFPYIMVIIFIGVVTGLMQTNPHTRVISIQNIENRSLITMEAGGDIFTIKIPKGEHFIINEKFTFDKKNGIIIKCSNKEKKYNVTMG